MEWTWRWKTVVPIKLPLIVQVIDLVSQIIFIWLAIVWFAYLWYKMLDVKIIQNSLVSIIKVDSMVIKEEGIISEVGDTKYGWEVVHVHELYIIVHVPWWGVIYDPVNCNIVMNLLCIFGSLMSDVREYEALPIFPSVYILTIISPNKDL